MTVKVCDFGLSQIKLRGVNLKDGQEGAKGVSDCLSFSFLFLLPPPFFCLFLFYCLENNKKKQTPLWMAPEVLLGQPFNEKADVYRYVVARRK
jgi:hypothetical protein